MAEEDLKKAILERIQRERDAILSQARAEAERILQQARAEADSLREGFLNEIRKACLSRKTKELSGIILDARRKVLEAKEKKIQEAFSYITIRRDKTIYNKLLQESLESFSKGAKLKLKVNPRDKELASEIVKGDIKIETLESIDGGLILSDLEENIIVVNTFSSRMEKLMPEIRQEIGKIL